MTHAELRAAVEQAVGSVAFVPPISKEYCEQVRDALRRLAPAAASVEAYYHVATKRSAAVLFVEARSGAAVYKLNVTLP